MRTFLLTVGALTLLAACGAGGGRASVSPGTMPPGGSFTGVWHSQQYGEMHMVQNGTAVVGEYTKDERHGRIQGTVNGDLMRFEWTENREMVQGVPSTMRGRGYFQYTIGEDERHYILGEWGIDDNEVGGGPWRAYKLNNRRPQLSTDGGGTTSGDENLESFDSSGGGGDDFDSDSGGDVGDSGGGESDTGGGGDDLDVDSLDL